MVGWWGGAGAMLVVAVAAGIADRRRRMRADLDRVGIVDWPTLQMLALIAAAVLAILALNA